MKKKIIIIFLLQLIILNFNFIYLCFEKNRKIFFLNKKNINNNLINKDFNKIINKEEILKKIKYFSKKENALIINEKIININYIKIIDELFKKINIEKNNYIFKLKYIENSLLNIKNKNNNFNIGEIKINLFFNDEKNNKYEFLIFFTTKEVEEIKKNINNINNKNFFLISEKKILNNSIKIKDLLNIIKNIINYKKIPKIIPKKINLNDENWIIFKKIIKKIELLTNEKIYNKKINKIFILYIDENIFKKNIFYNNKNRKTYKYKKIKIEKFVNKITNNLINYKNEINKFLLNNYNINDNLNKIKYNIKKNYQNLIKNTWNIKLNINITKLIYNIIPDIIHINNFLNENKNENNLILLIIKYLFSEPININNDNFLYFNNNLNIKNNLENIIHNILQNWKILENDINNNDDDNDNFLKEVPLNIEIWNNKLKWDSNFLFYKNIKNFNISFIIKIIINNLINNDDENNELNFLNINYLSNYLLSFFKKELKILKNKILNLLFFEKTNNDNIYSKIIEGNIYIEIKIKKENNFIWKKIENIEEIINQKIENIRIKLEKVKINIYSKKDKNLNIIIDKKNEIIILIDL